MSSKTPLQRTIHNLAMNSGSVKMDNWIIQVDEKNLESILKLSLDGKVFPLLHSLNKLTEPVLDGGKVPIVELFKIARGCYEMEIKDRYIDVKSSNEVQIELGHSIYHFGLFSFQNCDVRLGANYFFEMYETDLRLDNRKEVQVYCQNILFDQLNIWFFNTENLQPDEFIEIETLKEKKRW